MRDAIEAYSGTAQVTLSPRDFEASLLLKAASQLQNVQNSWSGRTPELDEALLYNRKLWTVLVSAMAETDNQLPIEVRNNVASLGAFVLNHILEIQKDPASEKLTSLININREIAAGLQAKVDGE